MEKNKDLESPLIEKNHVEENTCSTMDSEDIEEVLVECLEKEDETDKLVCTVLLMVLCFILWTYISFFLEVDKQLMLELSFKQKYLYAQYRNKIGFYFEGDDLIVITFYDTAYTCNYLSQFISGNYRCLNYQYNAYEDMRW